MELGFKTYTSQVKVQHSTRNMTGVEVGHKAVNKKGMR